MKVVKPWISVEDYDPQKILKSIEKACRTCYRSEDLITEDSYKKLLKNCITRGHESILEHEKVTVFEALYDLDFIGNNEEAHHYKLVDISKQFNGTAEKMKSLLRKRTIDGKENLKIGKSFSEWSREGRLIERYQPKTKPFYVRNFEGLQKSEKYFDILWSQTCPI